MPAGLIAGTDQEPGETVMALGELGMLFHQPAIGRDRRLGVIRLDRPDGAEFARKGRANIGGHRARQDRTAGLEGPVVEAGTIRMGKVPIRRQ